MPGSPAATPRVPVLLVLMLVLTPLACTPGDDTDATGANETGAAQGELAVAGIDADWRGDAPGVRYHIQRDNLLALIACFALLATFHGDSAV